MLATFTLIVGLSGRQSARVDLSTQRIDDLQHIFQPQGRLACLEIDDEAPAHAAREYQPGLGQPELLAGGAQCFAELLR